MLITTGKLQTPSSKHVRCSRTIHATIHRGYLKRPWQSGRSADRTSLLPWQQTTPGILPMLSERLDFHRMFDALLTLSIWLRREGWAFNRCPDSLVEWGKWSRFSTPAQQLQLHWRRNRRCYSCPHTNESRTSLPGGARATLSVKKNTKDIVTLSDDDVKLGAGS